MEFYILEDRMKRGPFTVDELRSRGILPDTQVQINGGVEWLPASRVPELAGLFSFQQQEQGSGQPNSGSQQQEQFGQSAQGYTQQTYQQAQQGYGAAPNAYQGGLIPKEYKTESILMIVFGVLACCCCTYNVVFLIFGILALSASNKVIPYYSAGNMQMAQYQSERAKKMLLWGLIGGIAWAVIGTILYYVFFFNSAEMTELLDVYKEALEQLSK